MSKGNNTNVKFNNYVAKKQDPRVNVQRGVFFDGTGNNMNNIDDPNKDPNLLKWFTDSYKGGYSNIARLYQFSPPSGYRIYIDGIGTTTKGSDDVAGLGTGRGNSGIKKRVEEACNLFAKSIPPGTKINTLTIDTFGFSRGASAARHFVSVITDAADTYGSRGIMYGLLGECLEKRNITYKQLIIRFVGLFDTVSSLTVLKLDPRPIVSNVQELGLNDLYLAQQVVHFTALDEHRDFFGLTRTHKGIQKNFPGVHSDIGGGYRPGEQEVVENLEEAFESREIELINLKKALVAEGWYKNTELIMKEYTVSTGEAGYYTVKYLRGSRTLKNTYSFIPLHLMAELAFFKKNVPILRDRLENRYSINKDPFLVKIKKRMGLYVTGNEKLVLPEDDLRFLRGNYLHWSSDKNPVKVAKGNAPAENRQRRIF